MKKALPLLLVAVSAVLLFWRLDGIPLWRDETTTANWGRLMAESGVWVPRTFDGEQLLVQAADGHDTNSRMLPAMQSWLQFYVAAAGFKLFGADTFTARLPFAVIDFQCGAAVTLRSTGALPSPASTLMSMPPEFWLTTVAGRA